ncbi:MAG: flagellar protein export ATPase FliI [Alphaproteobacteria bacterium]|nr:flagellar protein export ATPase FliI [Alphaproteobacteria bacterium]
MVRQQNSPLSRLNDLVATARASNMSQLGGRVTEIGRNHYLVEGLGNSGRLGDIVTVGCGSRQTMGEIIRMQVGSAVIKPFEATDSIKLGETAWLTERLDIRPALSWKGRTLDALANPIDGLGGLEQGSCGYARDRPPPDPMSLQRITKPVKTGVRVIDMFTPICCGQRIGIFAGSGVGKSSLLSMLAQGNSFDSVVLALVGERGREVRDFLDDVLGSQKDRTVAIVASSAESAMMRRLAAHTAMCVAEFLRDSGEDVLLIVDSLTRYAYASREFGLAAGEPPVARGFPPSVFADLPRLLERSGPGHADSGSITGVFSVLIEGDDHNDPVADTIRGILDGHIVLDRAVADQGRYPAVNLLSSISRLAHVSWTPSQRELVLKLKGLVARFEDSRDLRSVGAYQPGADTDLDDAVRIVPKLYQALKQPTGETDNRNAFAAVADHLGGKNG